MQGRYQRRGIHGPDPRVRFDVIATVHGEGYGWLVRPSSKTKVQVKLACIGGASRFDFGSMKISMTEKIKYYGTPVHLSKKCANCGRPCILKVNKWFPEGTVMQVNKPTVIGEIEVSGFHLEDGMGNVEFVDPLIIQLGIHTATVAADETDGTVKFPGGEERVLKGISVKFSRLH